ncbi:RagB/SusD family nutrient uptake outer membrane protein [Winogradskyella sp. PE311]|uniref:RagB/SusD family nutrient uptake outer membrane protein n=1 Tax=Winogradskyella sp. PE311 TaxID=3366943 RepID=UPI0039813F4C
MKNFKKSLIFVLSVMTMFYTCTDLEEVLEDELTDEFSDNGVPDSSSETAGGVFPSGALAASYARLRNGSAGHGSYYSIQTVASDEMAIGQKGGDWFDGGIWLDMHRHTVNSSNGPINGTWVDAYGGIAEVNLALSGALSPDEMAQAKTIRAFFYWRLLDLYGRVKLITAPGADAPQSSRTDVFNFVEQELLDAIGIAAVTGSMDLSSSNLGTSNDPYIVNQYAAMGLLAKLYLNAEVYTGTGRYQEAAWAAGYVIDNGPYQLCDSGCSVTNLAKRPAVDTDPDQLTGYAAVFAPNNQFNPEMVWSIYYDQANAGGMNFSQMNLHYSSQQTFALDAQPWNGYQVLEEFYNSYEDTDSRKEANFLAGPQLDFGGSALLDFAADDDNLQVDYTPEITELEPNSVRQSGVRASKFSFQLFGRPDMNNDYPIMRLGDLYLIRGEAMARNAGDWNMALADVNTIRARAGVSALASLTADSFFDERGREMFQEASRRTDRVRFGKWGDSWWQKTNSDAFRTVFPIPQEQIEASAGTLTQNPGY